MAPVSPRRGLDSTAVGDEGGFAPAVADPEEVGIDRPWWNFFLGA